LQPAEPEGAEDVDQRPVSGVEQLPANGAVRGGRRCSLPALVLLGPRRAPVGDTSVRTTLRPICCGHIDRAIARHAWPGRRRWAVRAVRTVEKGAMGSKIWEAWKRRSAENLGKYGLSSIRHPEWGSAAQAA